MEFPVKSGLYKVFLLITKIYWQKTWIKLYFYYINFVEQEKLYLLKKEKNLKYKFLGTIFIK
jgi:hypothetical protein